VDITVSFHGPIFSGAAAAVIDDITMQAQEEVADAALQAVHSLLNRNIKHPTPYYETQIIHQRLGRVDIVHDRGIIYGPWLEGTSSRNATTRFKGYASFRKARQEVEALTPEIVDRVVAKNIGRLQ
jgi:hypothetical protein